MNAQKTSNFLFNKFYKNFLIFLIKYMENLLVTMIIFILLFKSKKKGEFQK